MMVSHLRLSSSFPRGVVGLCQAAGALKKELAEVNPKAV
jgi:hypothetical protein